MRISLLLRREPFGPILERTLTKFWSAQLGSPHDVVWGRRAARETGQRWLYNGLVNAIFVPGVSAGAFGPVRREYGRSRSLWQRPLQWLYVQAATRSPTAKLLARPAMSVSPPVPGAEELLVLGGNNRIRLLDRGLRRSYVVLKDRFNSHFIDRELTLRQAAWPLPAPELIKVAADGSWFAEAYVEGTPLNRLSTESSAASALDQVSTGLQRLSEATEERIAPSAYAGEVSLAIDELLDGHPWLDGAGKAGLERVAAEIATLVREGGSSVGEIATVQTHGDFQPANILVNGDQAWLIDWEYTARRQRAYDPLVYALGTRLPPGQLASRVSQAIEGDLPGQSLLLDWPHLQWGDRTHRAVALALFLLEEMALRLEEAANPQFHGATSDFRWFQLEVKDASDALKAAASGTSGMARPSS